MKNLKGIIGNSCQINADNEIGILITSFNPMWDLLTIHRYGETQKENAIANLIVDSLNTANKCGKLPSQLLQENEEMKAMLEFTIKYYGKVSEEKLFLEIQQLLTKINE